jgi:tape measure domain-containing protein
MKKTIDLTISTSAKGSGFEETQSKLQRLRSSFASTSRNIAKGVMSQMANIKAAWDMGVGAIRSVASVFAKAIGEAFKFEKATSDFKVLLGNIEAAKQHINDLRAFASSTPLTFGDLSQASKLLLSFGTSVEEVMPSLQTLGDIAMGDAQKFQGLALVFAQVKSQGKLMGQDLLQMVNQGFNPLTIIAKETGKTMSELKDMMSEGQISFEMVAEAMRLATSEGGLFHNAMKEASQTGEGMVSTLQDRWTDAVRTFGESFSGAAKGGIAELSDSLKRLTEDGSIAVWADKMASAVTSVIGKLKEAGEVVSFLWNKTGLSDVWHGVNSVVQGTGAAIGTLVGGGSLSDAGAAFEEASVEEMAKGHYTRKMMESGVIGGKAVDKLLEADKIDAEIAAKKEAEIRAAGKKREEKKETPGGIKAGKTLAEMMESVEVKAKEKTEKKKAKVEKDSNRKRLQEEKKALQERIKALQAANERELALIDARIEAEKMKAEEWERNAAGMREAAKGGGRGFSNFIRSRRDAEKDEQKENRMREMALRRARAQMENIEERARRRPLGRLTADEKRRWQEAKQFIDAQDARNNPALKAAEELEKKRAAAVDNVRKAIEKIEKVIETKVAL